MSQNKIDDQQAIRLIDQRQNQLLEDLDDLNQRILEIIESYNAGCPDQEQGGADQLEPAA